MTDVTHIQREDARVIVPLAVLCGVCTHTHTLIFVSTFLRILYRARRGGHRCRGAHASNWFSIVLIRVFIVVRTSQHKCMNQICAISLQRCSRPSGIMDAGCVAECAHLSKSKGARSRAPRPPPVCGFALYQYMYIFIYTV